MEKTLRQQDYSGIRVVLFGPESTGKTTLARALAVHYNSPEVAEFMRTFLEERGPVAGPLVSREEIMVISEGQIRAENQAVLQDPEVLICDTNVLELLVYSRYYFDGWAPEALVRAVDALHYHHYFLTAIDWPWVADDLRDRPEDRENMFRIFEQELTNRQLPYTLLTGPFQARFDRACQVINQLKTSPNA